jgi:hypothetical protein
MKQKLSILFLLLVHCALKIAVAATVVYPEQVGLPVHFAESKQIREQNILTMEDSLVHEDSMLSKA